VCLAQATALLCACLCALILSDPAKSRSVQPAQISLIKQAVGCSSPSDVPPEGPDCSRALSLHDSAAAVATACRDAESADCRKVNLASVRRA
jgi:hypothetical protein